jgi:hypothetical protein
VMQRYDRIQQQMDEQVCAVPDPDFLPLDSRICMPHAWLG